MRFKASNTLKNTELKPQLDITYIIGQTLSLKFRINYSFVQNFHPFTSAFTSASALS